MTSGLRFDRNLDEWHAWRARQNRIRALKGRLAPTPAPTPRRLIWTSSAAQPSVVVAVASSSASGLAALVAPLAPLADQTSTAVVAEFDISAHLPGWTVSDHPVSELVRRADAVLADGHYMALGHELWQLARLHDPPYFVAQHGLVTPLAPPLTPGATLLAWSEADAEFWKSGRTDVEHRVVGSQLLWNARAGVEARGSADEAGPLTYLGQMHGAELQRGKLTRAAAAFCREHGATYRPHPSERDKLSRLAHAAYRRVGISVDGSRPLNELTGPVASVFSTGVLEAAAQGRDAWVDFPRPPAWLEEFWERYGMHQYGDSPTPAPPRPEIEPARRIAEILMESIR